VVGDVGDLAPRHLLVRELRDRRGEHAQLVLDGTDVADQVVGERLVDERRRELLGRDAQLGVARVAEQVAVAGRIGAQDVDARLPVLLDVLALDVLDVAGVVHE
jgi:hypothetical protein